MFLVLMLRARRGGEKKRGENGKGEYRNGWGVGERGEKGRF